MKTTVELPDELLAQAKEYARTHGTTLRELLSEGLRDELERRASAERRPDFVLPTFGEPGADWALPTGDAFIELAYGDRG